jgi:hypothetical protein
MRRMFVIKEFERIWPEETGRRWEFDVQKRRGSRTTTNLGRRIKEMNMVMGKRASKGGLKIAYGRYLPPHPGPLAEARPAIEERGAPFAAGETDCQRLGGRRYDWQLPSSHFGQVNQHAGSRRGCACLERQVRYARAKSLKLTDEAKRLNGNVL